MKKYCSHHMKYVRGFYREGKVQVSEKTRTGWKQKCVKMNERIDHIRVLGVGLELACNGG